MAKILDSIRGDSLIESAKNNVCYVKMKGNKNVIR
jgi:hypothetical protein